MIMTGTCMTCYLNRLNGKLLCLIIVNALTLSCYFSTEIQANAQKK